MEFGLFSNGERGNTLAADTYDEDLFEIVTADKLGFREVWVSEHVGRSRGTRPDTVPVADLLICKAAALTKRIRLGPGVRPLGIYHPIQVAMDAAMCDHLMRGRYMFGFGTGGPADDQMVQRGIGANDTALRRARMHEAIQLILRCWTEEEPFDFEGEFWQGQGINVLPKPFQKPWPTTGVASSGTLGTIQMAAEHGFVPVLSQYDEAGHIQEMGDAFAAACQAAGKRPRRGDIRACRYVYVSDSVKKATEELRPTITPSIERHKKYFPHHFEHSLPASGKVEDVTWDHLVESGHYFVGDPDRVAELIRDFYTRSGGFGVLLLLMGKDYGTRQQRARSMKLFMEQVAPQLRDLDPDRAAPLEAVY